MALSAKRVINGTWGSLTFEGEEFAEISAFSLKDAYNKETIAMAGQMAEDGKITGIKRTGSMTLKKVYSRFKDHSASIDEGIDTRYTLIGKLADPDSYGTERVAAYGVSLDENTLMDFTVGKTTEITIPFTYTSFEYLSSIDA